MSSNQLKLNLNTVVDGLNLVNVVQRPQPIVITGAAGRSYSPPTRDHGLSRNQSGFEVIDEKKLSMYSYLVKREMKTKEWLSKFNLDYPGPASALESSKAPEKKKSATSVPKVPTARKETRLSRVSGSKPSNGLEELKKCCDETVRSIEYLEQKLSECNTDHYKNDDQNQLNQLFSKSKTSV